MTTVVGIDPGVNGALAVVTHGKVVVKTPLDVFKIRKGKTQRTTLDITAVHRRLFSMASFTTHVWIEQIGTRPGQGIVSSGNLMRAFGQLEGVIASMHVPYSYVTPQVWQRVMRCGPSPDAARQRLLQLQPDIDVRAMTEHEVDACLIALYGFNLQPTEQAA